MAGRSVLAVGTLVSIALPVALLQSAPHQQAAGMAALAVAAVCTAVVATRGTTALAAMVFTVAVLLLPLNGIRQGGVTAADVALVAAALLALPHARLGSKIRHLPLRFLVGVYLFIVAGLGGSLTAGGVGVGNFVRLVVTMTAMIVGVLLWRPDLARVRMLAMAWLIGNTVSVLAALVTLGTLPVWARPKGLTTHPNAFGLICALSVGFAFFLHSAARGSRDRAAALLLGAAAGVGIALSGSRAAVLAVVVVVVARIALGGRIGTAVVAASGIGIGWIVLLKVAARLPPTSAPHRLLYPSASVEASDSERLGRLRDSVEAVQQHPWFGSGFAEATAAHNVFFQVAVAAGLVGAAGFVLAVLPTFSALRRRVPEPYRWLGLLPLTYFTAAMVANNLWDRYVWFCLALGMVAAIGPAPDRDIERPRSGEPSRPELPPQSAGVPGR